MLSDFIISRQGEFAALLTAIFWTLTAIAFESASRKIGSLPVNLLRLFFAFLFLTLLTWVTRGLPLPIDATPHQWLWLSLSGLVGFVLGDLFLFRAYVVVGARISMLIMSFAPPIAALIDWVWLGQALTPRQGFGMIVIIIGVAMVVLQREGAGTGLGNGLKGRLKFSYPLYGLLLALGGAVGQGGGLVLSKYGMANYDVFAAVQIRVITGIAGFLCLTAALSQWGALRNAISHGVAMKRLVAGSLFGPFLGVSFSLWAVRYTSAGAASAIMSIVPVLLIPFSIYIYREKLSIKEIIGAFIAIGGVFLFFI